MAAVHSGKGAAPEQLYVAWAGQKHSCCTKVLNPLSKGVGRECKRWALTSDKGSAHLG